MEEFLQSLTPALAGVVRDAVGEVGQDRLQQTVSLYTHDIDGSLTWPTERYTAEMVALQFIRDVRPVVSPATASGIDGALGRRAAVSAGTGALLTGVGAAAGVYGAQKTMLALTSKVVQRHYEEIDLDFTTYRNLMQSIVAGALRNTTNRANWNLIGSAFAQVGFDPTTWENQVAARFQNELLSNLVGVFARAAWTGQKRTLDQLPIGVVLPDFESSVGQWARNHVERVVYDQNRMTHRVVRGIVNRLQESGAGPQTITSRLRKMWGLTPRDALAVENYRTSLAEQGKKHGMINRLADAYVDRLMKQRISLLARTETMNSINMGKQLMWERAMHEGKLPIDIMKIWVTAADEAVCPVCRPMDRVKIPLTSMFTTASGKVVMPPVHPRCRCIAMLVEPEIADLGDYAVVITQPSTSSAGTSSADILVGKHFGPGPHPSGTPQVVHAGGEAGRHARLASFLNSKGDEKVELDVLREMFGAEYINKVSDGVFAWQASFAFVTRAREMLKGNITPGEVRRKRQTDEALMTMAEVAQYAPANAPTLYRGMTIKAPIEQVVGMFKKGQTFDPTIASFSSDPEIASSYSLDEVWSFMRRGRQSVTFVLEEGSRGLSIEPIGRNAPMSLFETLEEWVVRGDLVVTGVKQTGPNNVEVKMRQETGISKVKSEELISALWEFPFYALSHSESVDKHFGGPSGKENHPITGSPQTIHNKGGSGNNKTPVLAAAGLTALAVGGFFILKKTPPGFVLRAVDDLPVSGSKPLLSGDLGKWASEMNKGINPNQGWIDDMITVLKGDTLVLRMPYESGQLAGRTKDFVTMVSGAPAANRPLYRTIRSSDDAFASYEPGRTFTMGPSSFSQNKVYAEVKNDLPGAVTFVTKPKTRALSIDSWRPKDARLALEEEWLAAGKFRITKVSDEPGMRWVEIEQTDLLEPGQVAQWIAKLLSKHMGPGPHPSGSPQEVHSIRTFKPSIRTLKSGDMAMFPTKELDAATEGYGFRFGNTGRILEMANSMLRGEDLFTRDGKTQPIMVMIYRDGQRVFDGKHRLAAARLIGREEVPIQVARVNRKMPEPRTVRERWDERRRQKYRERLASQPSGTVGYEQKVRELNQVQERFNRRMEERSRKADERMFADLGITRGDGRWVAIKKDLSTVTAT